MSERRETLPSGRLRDERGRRVVFVSHCLLNENTRYLGGAFHSGAVPEIAELQRLGIGIHQMRCPERQAWCGTVKRLMIPAYGSKGTVLYRFRAPLLCLFVWYTRVVYWRQARAVVRDIREYQRSGVSVVAIVGVWASPSGGVIGAAGRDRILGRGGKVRICGRGRRDVWPGAPAATSSSAGGRIGCSAGPAVTCSRRRRPRHPARRARSRSAEAVIALASPWQSPAPT